jgi:hypothetical protein
MLTLILRRLAGIAAVLAAIVYGVAKLYEYDMPNFEAPSWVHSPAFWIGIALIAVWAWLPVLLPVGNREVSLAQELPRKYVDPKAMENEPFEMPPGSGEWYIIWDGQYMFWDEQTDQWAPYRG